MRSKSEWHMCTLGEAINLKRGYDLPNRQRNSGNVPIISSSGIAGFHNEAKVKGPGVITGRYGTLGEVFYVREDFWPLNTSLYVEDFKGNSPIFISYFLRCQNFANQNVAGAVPGVNRNYLHMLPVAVPPLPTQKKIASVLSAYDDLIENNERRIKILEEMAQSIYREWFVNYRFPGHENVRMVDSELGEIPEGWKVMCIKDMCSYLSRGISPRYDESSPSLVLGQRCVRNNRVDLSPSRTHASKVDSYKFIRFGDVLVNSTGVGSLGRTAQVYEDIDDCTVDSHVTIVRPNPEVDIDFFGFTIFRLEEYFENLASGSTGQTELRRDVIGDTTVIVPNEIQMDLGKTIRPLRSYANQLGALNQNLRQTRDLLLPKLISGELDVEELDIAVA